MHRPPHIGKVHRTSPITIRDALEVDYWSVLNVPNNAITYLYILMFECDQQYRNRQFNDEITESLTRYSQQGCVQQRMAAAYTDIEV